VFKGRRFHPKRREAGSPIEHQTPRMPTVEGFAFAASIGSGALSGMLGFTAAGRLGRRSVVWAFTCALFPIGLIVLAQLPIQAGEHLAQTSSHLNAARDEASLRQWMLRISAAALVWFVGFCVGELHLRSPVVALMEAKLLGLWFDPVVVDAPVPSVLGPSGILQLRGEFGGLLAGAIVAGALAVLLRRPSWFEIVVLPTLGLAVSAFAHAAAVVQSVDSWLSNEAAAPELSPVPYGLGILVLFWTTVSFAWRRLGSAV
jgi:hypothetical protein